MDNVPIEYRDRILAEQIATMEALQIIAQLLICFTLLVAFVILIVNIALIVRLRFYHSESEEGEFQKGSTRGISERLRQMNSKLS